MKKALSVLFAVLLIASIVTVAAQAKTVPFEDGYVSKGDVVFASFHNVKPFIADQKNAGSLDDAVIWLAENAESYNLKYVSFIGNMSSGANYTYKEIVTNQKRTRDELISLNENDEEWQKDFNLLRKTASEITDAGVPYGVSINLDDYYSEGFQRENHMQNCFQLSDFTGAANVEQIAYDNNTYATVTSVGKQRYIIYQLEAFPRKKTLEWFNTVQQTYPDARAIIYTTSFAQANGEMHTQHDYSLTKTEWLKVYKNYTSTMRTNMLHDNDPHDGINLWKNAFSNWDNILCIVSANASTGKDIVTKTFTNDRGVQVVSVVADLESGYAKEELAFPVLIKVSADNKTLDIRYAAPYEGYVEDSKTVITLDKIGDLPEADPVTFLPKIAPKANGNNPAYINGYADNIFKPNGNMTKAEAATIFARLLLGTQTIPEGYTSRFSDVKEGDWYYNAIAYLDETGFLYSTDSDSYQPDKAITRAEFVELAYLASSIDANTDISFKDVDSSNKYYKAITAAAASGIVNGYGDKTFKPDNTITRAEVVTVINRLLALYADKEAIGKENLSTVFSDIEGHWAEYQILLASNAKVQSPQYYKADLSAVTESATDISFGNKYFKISIAKKNGKVTDIVNLMTGESVLAVSAAPIFATVKTAAGSTVNPSDVSLENGRVKFSFNGFCDVYFLIESFDEYITVTLDSNLPSSLKSLSFGCLSADYEWELDNENAFGLSGIAMTTTVDPGYFPGGSSKAVSGTVYTAIGAPSFGSKFGIAFSRMTEHRDHLKAIIDAIDPAKGIKSTNGGPYALDNPKIYGDYVILSGGLTPETAVETAQLAKRYSVDQIDVHRGASTFYTADFNFVCARNAEEKENKTFIPASVFKERIADKVTAEGIQLSLHTYSSLVPRDATRILSNPTWQKQICYDPQTYTLRGKLTRFRTNIKTNEDASKIVIDGLMPWNGGSNTRYILIDEEIILIQQGTTSGFLNVKRGQLGTKAAEHQDGAEIRQLRGWFSMFQPIPLSDLFYHVAEATAKAYNEGGFEMIYLDGLESFNRDGMTPEDQVYYAYAEFVRTVVSNCDKDPLIEYSSFPTSVWNARGRGGAVDCAFRGYKAHKASHMTKQEKFHEYFYTATVGWFNYAPDMNNRYKDVLVATMYRDDLDFMGALALANNFGTVCQPFSVENFKQDTMLADNFAYYGIYSRLRESGYFAPEVKEKLLTREHEYKVFEKADGSWAFKEMEYFKHRVFMLSDLNLTTGKGENPFAAQDPFIRIEQGYSSLGEEEIIVKEFDETKPVKSLVGSYNISSVNCSKNYAFAIKVLGNGSSSDKVSISVKGSDGTNRMDIPTNFTGWKDIIIMESDNSGREYCNLTGVTSVSVAVTGNCTGVMIDDLRSVKIVEAPVKDPSVSINGKTITFNTELNSGEYIEYYPEKGKAYLTYYVYEFKEDGTYVDDKVFVKEIPFTGSVTVPTGAFTYVYNAQSQTNAPTRADVVIGVSGAIIENPADWTAPEVEIPDDLMEFKFE